MKICGKLCQNNMFDTIENSSCNWVKFRVSRNLEFFFYPANNIFSLLKKIQKKWKQTILENLLKKNFFCPKKTFHLISHMKKGKHPEKISLSFKKKKRFI